MNPMRPSDNPMILSVSTGDRQGRMWIGTFNGITLFDPFEEKYIDLATLYKGCELPRGVVVGLSIASDGAVWVVTKMGVYNPSEWKMYLFGSVKRTLYKQYGIQCR